jgi:hypothetical protein
MIKDKYYKLITLFFLILALAHFVVTITIGPRFMLLWFCYLTTILFIIGSYLKNNFIISTVVTSMFIVHLIWIQDTASYLIFGRLNVGIMTYLFDIGRASFFTTFYHFFLLIIPILLIFDMKKFHKLSWLGASAFFFIASILTLIFTKSDINCVRGTCEYGIFNFLTIAYASPLPPFMINWLAMTIIIFIPTHLFFRKVVKWVSK